MGTANERGSPLTMDTKQPVGSSTLSASQVLDLRRQPTLGLRPRKGPSASFLLAK